MAFQNSSFCDGLWKTPELTAKCVRLHKQYGLSPEVLAKRFGWSLEDVRRILKGAGIKIRHPRAPITKGDVARMIELHGKGKSVDLIAVELEIAPATVWKWLKIQGVKLDSRGGGWQATGNTVVFDRKSDKTDDDQPDFDDPDTAATMEAMDTRSVVEHTISVGFDYE